MNKYFSYVGYPKGHFSFNTATWLLILSWLLTPLLFWLLSHFLYMRKVYQHRKRQQLSTDVNEVVVIVLGDLGHSPRMTYHAQSFQKLGYQVNLCGYLESALPEAIYHDDISIYEIPVIHNTLKLPYLVFASLKVMLQVCKLTMMLRDIIGDNTRFVIVQNPPSLPLLAILGFLKFTWSPNIQLIVDWHNLNWSIINLKYRNKNNLVVKLMKWYEKWFSNKVADFNLTVTVAMKKYLHEEFGLKNNRILVLYDRPSEVFEPLVDHKMLDSIIQQNQDLFQDVHYDQNTDRIVVSSTSFTPDEDFHILIDALKILDKILTNNRIIMIVTGKGPLLDNFLSLTSSYCWTHIVIKNVWLPIEQYPNVLKIADLGVSLHYSSSGLDLPMKIVDLFGSGVPALTLKYPVISELVKDGKNGIVLRENNSKEMADTMFKLLYQDKDMYVEVKQGALLESKRHWDDEWNSKLSEILSLKNKRRI